MPDSRRLLVLALDAASPRLLMRWAADGTLPHLAKLLERGMRAPTRSVEGVYVGATWPSFFMGRQPGDHGLYWLDRILVGTYRRQQAGPGELSRYPALWEVLGEAGRRVVVLDVPLAPLSARVKGAQVVEWGVHDAVFGFRTRPSRWAAEIEARFGRHPAPPHCDAKRSAGEARSFAEQLVAGAGTRARLTLDLLAAEPDWSFAIQVFSETHCAGHQLWHTHDSTHPAHDPGGEDLVRRVYRAVDDALGEILAGLDDETTVAVMALHGMGPAGGHSLLLQKVLRRLGVEAGDEKEGAEPDGGGDAGGRPVDRGGGGGGGGGSGGGARRRGVRSLLRALYRRLPEAVRTPVYEARQRRNQRLGRGSPIDLDPARTRAFYVGLGTGAPFSAVRLNLRGREPAGTLSPGPEADAFVGELVSELEALIDPRTGRPAVVRVLRASDLFTGPRVDELPDLLVEWEMGPPRGTTAAGEGREALWELVSPRLGRIALTNDYCRTGEHRPEGFVVLAGPAVPTGVLDRTVSIVDLAPTFAALLGCPTPTMAGRPVPEFLGGGPSG